MLSYLFYKFNFIGKKLPRILPQRWTGHIAAVNIIRDNFTEVAQCLFEVAGLSLEESAEAEGLLNRFISLEFSFNLLALCKILAILNPLNNYFETTYSDIATAKRLLASTTQTLQTIRSDQIFNEILFDATKLMSDTEMTTDNISIASKRCHRLPITLSKDYFMLDEGDRAFATTNSTPYFETMFKRIYFNLIDTFISELRNRFTERSLSIVTACFCLLFQRARSLEKCNIIKSLLNNNEYINNLNAELMVLHNGLLKDEYSNLSELAADFLPHR